MVLGHGWRFPGLTESAGNVQRRKGLQLRVWFSLRVVGFVLRLAGTRCGTSSLRQSSVIDVSTCAMSFTGDLVVVSRFVLIYILSDFGSSMHHQSK